NLDQRRVLQKDTHAGNAGHFGPQAFNDCFDVLMSIVHRLEQNQNISGVAGSADIALPDRRQDAEDIFVFANDVDDLFLVTRHFGKGNSFGSFGVTDNAAGVVGRDEALGNDVEKPNRDQKQHAANEHRQGAVLEG